MSGPRQGTPMEQLAASMTNEALAHRVDMLRDNRRAFAKDEADAFLREAGIRLRWPSSYAAHTTTEPDA